MEWTKRLGMDDRFTERYLNEGFSGGEKKRNEILQMAMMEPDVAVLDETDCGLDIDALRDRRATASPRSASDRPELGILLITHYQRILEHLTPDVVHVLLDGRIVGHGRPGARAADRGRGLRDVSVRKRWSERGHSTCRAHQGRLPDPEAHRSTASGSSTSTPRRRRRSPSPVLDAMDEHYRELLRQRAPRRVHDRRGVHRRVRGRARRRSPASSARRSAQRDRVHQEHHRGDQPRRVLVGARQPPRRRRHRAHRDGAPRQHRAVAHPRRRARRRAALDPPHRRLPPRPDATSTGSSTAPSSSPSPRCRTCSAPSTTSGPSPTPPTPPARTCSSTPCQAVPHVAVDVQAWDADFVGVHRPQDARPDAASAGSGPAPSCSRRCRRSSAAAR